MAATAMDVVHYTGIETDHRSYNAVLVCTAEVRLQQQLPTDDLEPDTTCMQHASDM